ncbi:hypothetical protein BDQ12DRAFT_744289 [Crucibulum laeve]|uniref:non-specific serine/threonine protein kinase n=1 Tax=Crucibulum laeve TaxID=68775 RepID=A0A5C3LJ93_9AGAR|nr:hypothetical protein BDQ12DRAFT_744289 [Crucibulum laeve]
MAPVLSIFSATICALSSFVFADRTPQPSESQALAQRAKPAVQYQYVPPIQQATLDLTKDLELLDIVLIASVDGKFHALNRTSGLKLWSMASFATTTSVSAPATLGPLVRTTHSDHDPETTDESARQETYIIEPQSGDIYVMATPTSPLQRFPYSMAELVDMSPFTFSGDGDRRVFVGKKETSLMLIELETGKIKATLSSECPVDPFGDLQDTDDDEELDLDELEGSKPKVSAPTEVYIGRTDYHISIHTRPHNRSGLPPPPVQNLSFSTYGPNNQDNVLQAAYRRTRDDAYIQSLPNGEILSFKARKEGDTTGGNSHLLWYNKFNTPIVAIFDVLHNTSHHSAPFALLQPRPRLQDAVPNFSPNSQLPLDSAYVGMVEETGSLFAMSPDRFPLVVFGGNDQQKKKLIEGSGMITVDGEIVDEDDGEEPIAVDELTRLRKLRERERLRCALPAAENDRRCLVGLRPLGDTDKESRMKRLLDGPGSVEGRLPQSQDVFVPPKTHPSPFENDNKSVIFTGVHATAGAAAGWLRSGAMWEAVVVSLVLGLLSVMWIVKRARGMSLAKIGSGREMNGNGRGGVVDMNVGRDFQQVTDAVPVDARAGANPSVDSLTDKPLPPPPEGTGIGLASVSEVPATVELEVPSPVRSAPPPPSQPPATPGAEDGEESERDGDGVAEGEGTRKKLRRGKRGGGKKKKAAAAVLETETEGEGEKENKSAEKGKAGSNGGGKKGKGKKGANGVANGNGNGAGKELEPEPESPATPQSALVFDTPTKPTPATAPSLIVSDTILGFGSHGTVVFQGSLQGRAVAVKRLLQDFVTLASREVSILQESDDHPNVIRYYYQEAHANFLYIALELCPASLADIIEYPDRWPEIRMSFDPKKALKQITSGLRHLHALKLVHRDIKPQNILVSSAKAGPGGTKAYRMLISDFGLCKKLDVDQTSFLPTAHGAMAAGTVGWRAPEILRGEVKLDDLSDDASMSSRGSVATINGSSGSTPTTGTAKPTRLTKSVDIFALGCLFYYTMTSGGHPFGDRFEREVNILKNAKNLEALELYEQEEGTEAADLITQMLAPEASERPDTTTCLLHPYFWDPGRRLNFLQDASDRFEIMCRDPKDPNLLALEKTSFDIVGNDWLSRLDRTFIENLGKFRKYDPRSVQDLLRALRNKKHHYQDLPENVKRTLGPMPEGFLAYFTTKYPRLFLHVHGVIGDTGLQYESMFRAYFELPES